MSVCFLMHRPFGSVQHLSISPMLFTLQNNLLLPTNETRPALLQWHRLHQYAIIFNKQREVLSAKKIPFWTFHGNKYCLFSAPELREKADLNLFARQCFFTGFD